MTTSPLPERHEILIVEDSATQAEHLRAILERHGYLVRAARHGREALERLREVRPLLVVSDINMPEMDGYGLCRHIRADPELVDLPVILLTSLSDPDDVMLGLESGADNFVTKPIDEDYLLSRIRYIMANRHVRSIEGTRISLEISLRGRKHNITADRLQILHLLLSTYESAILRSRQLAAAQEELRRMNESLEQKVRERTAELSAEITERKHLHKELRRSEEHYRQLFASNPMPMWVFDRETLRFVAVNDSAVNHYGYSRQEFLEMTILDIRPPEDANLVREDAADPDSKLVPRAWRHHKKNGGAITVEITSGDLIFENRRARLVLANDVTERVRAHAALRASEERLAAVFRSAPVGIALMRLEGEILEVNEYLCDFLGYTRNELIGTTARDLHLWAQPRERAPILRLLARGQPVRNREVHGRTKSGETRVALLSLESLRLGESPLLLATIVNITQRKALEAELHQFHRTESVGRLASGIAHDMNNILAPILMGVSLVRSGMRPEDAEKILSTIEVCAQRGAALVRQLLIFGRGVEGERRLVDLNAVVDEVVNMCSHTFPRSITIRTSVVPDLWRVHGDATQLHQVLLNLAVNARDAMLDGGQLALSAENAEIDAQYAALHKEARPGPYVVLRVADTGTGIAPEVAERIFDPFFTTKELGQGTGLGLSTVHAIVKSHGGFLQLNSQPMRGTTFEVFLPATRTPKTEHRGKDLAKCASGNAELVLIVDDEEGIRAVLRATLVQYNYRVLSAQDGVEAAGVFAANPQVQLLITDLDMALMDGISLIRVLRRMKPDLRCIVSTGATGRSGAERHQQQLEQLGIKTVLPKPYTAERLLDAVRTTLRAERE